MSSFFHVNVDRQLDIVNRRKLQELVGSAVIVISAGSHCTFATAGSLRFRGVVYHLFLNDQRQPICIITTQFIKLSHLIVPPLMEYHSCYKTCSFYQLMLAGALSGDSWQSYIRGSASHLREYSEYCRHLPFT